LILNPTLHRVNMRNLSVSKFIRVRESFMKRSIQVSVLAIAMLMVGCVAASAQTSFGAKVNVPFSFNVGTKSYEPGEYTIRVNHAVYGASQLVIQGSRIERSQTVLLSNSAGSNDGEQKLIFGVENGVKYLSGITTEAYAFSLAERPKGAVTIVKIVNRPNQKTKM